jgi:hypothetical protein
MISQSAATSHLQEVLRREERHTDRELTRDNACPYRQPAVYVPARIDACECVVLRTVLRRGVQAWINAC